MLPEEGSQPVVSVSMGVCVCVCHHPMQCYVVLNWVRGTAAGLENPVLRILTGSRGLGAAGGRVGG